MTQTYYVNPTAGTNGNGSSGSPFDSIRHAYEAIGGAFNAATEDYVINLLAGAETKGTSCDWIFNSTSVTVRKLIIQALGTNRHTGVRSSGYRQNCHLNFYAGGNSTTTVDLELRGLATYSAAGGLLIQGIHTALLDGCAGFDNTSGAAIAVCGPTSSPILCHNCLAVNCGVATSGGAFNSYNQSGTPSSKWINCTSIASPDVGFRRVAGTVVLKNCYSGGCVTADYAGTMTRTNCMHSSAAVVSGSTASTAYSTANLTNVTAASEDAKLVSGSALIGAGNGPANDAEIPTTDFAGTARGGAATDVGFHQRTAYSGGAIETQLERGYLRGYMRGTLRGGCA